MRTGGNAFEMRDHLSECRETSVAGCSKHWNRWGRHSALSCRCVGKEADWRFVRFREELDYQQQLVEWLVQMCEQGAVSAIIGTLSVSRFCCGLMDFDSFTLMGIGCGIAIRNATAYGSSADEDVCWLV